MVKKRQNLTTLAAALPQERLRLIREKQRAAASSVLAGFFLTVMKLVAGIMTGSLGLLAEAAHSGLDFAAAALTWFAVRHSWRPPDRDHQFGHAKIENLTAFCEAILLVLTSVWVLYEAAERFLGRGPEVTPSVWAFVVMLGSVVIDIVRSRDLKRVAAKSGSQALEADALHFSTDIASSGVVIVGLICVALGRAYDIAWLRFADPLAASVVAIIVAVLSWQLGKRAVDMLLDRAPPGVVQRVERVLQNLNVLDGLDGKIAVRARQAGDQLFVDITLPMRRDLPIAQGDHVAALVRASTLTELGENTVVSLQFLAHPEAIDTLHQRVATAVAMTGQQAHNITIRQEEHSTHVDLHLELPADMSLGESHAIADQVEKRLLCEIPTIDRVDLHLELRDMAIKAATQVGDPLRAGLEDRILAAARTLLEDGQLHDLKLSDTSAGLYLSCHCFMPRATSLHEAHRLTESLEMALRAAVPELARVTVHAEPADSDREDT